MKLRYLAICTDLHITERDTVLSGIDTNASAQRLISAIQAEQLAELVVCLGDLADTTLTKERTKAVASPAAYEHAKQLMISVQAPFITIPGNHDDPELLASAFPNTWQQNTHGISRYRFHGLDLIGIDVRTGPEATGWISPDTIEELDRALHESKRAILLSHFPLFEMDNERISTGLSTGNRQDLLPCIRKHKEKIAASFNGHLHIWVSTVREGIVTTSVPSGAFSFALEPQSDEHEHVTDTPCGYLLVGVGAEGSIVIRSRFLPGAPPTDRVISAEIDRQPR